MALAQNQDPLVFDSDDDAIYEHASAQLERRQTEKQSRRRKSSSESLSKGERPEISSEDEVGNGDLSSDDEIKHPYYNYAQEKHDIGTDSKLIYQRHRMDTMSEKNSPLLLSKSQTLPIYGLEGQPLGRTTSVSSLQRQQQAEKRSSRIQDSGREPFPSLQEQAVAHKDNLAQFAAKADSNARDHKRHPQLPHEPKDQLLQQAQLHGSGAGMGIGSGQAGFARNEGAVVTEVEKICDKIKEVLDLRRAYQQISLQCPGDNPKDTAEWQIYPEPPQPVWHETSTGEQERPVSNGHEPTTGDDMQQSVASLVAPSVTSPSSRKKRKIGQAIGEDFDFDECEIPGKIEDRTRFELDDGSVFQVFDKTGTKLVEVPTLRDYYRALDSILEIASDGPAKSFAYRRLQYLDGRYNLYSLLNEYEEVADTKKVPHRDFYNVRKVDTHVHHSACMNQKHLLRFIKSKMKKSPDEIVIDRDGQKMSLKEVFESIKLTAYDLSIDTLDMHAHTDSFHRFDKFNLKYNPVGQSRLRDIFLKTDNYVKGRYLADITREVIADLEASKYQMVEWRISIYGRSPDEWDKLAAWVIDNKLFSHNVRWMIQIPRLYIVYKQNGMMENFQQFLVNIFKPLYEVTQDPSSHPKLHVFLQRVIGFDSVDDESKAERRLFRKFPKPTEWTTKQNPPYSYYLYYLFANMTSLNHWRKRRGFNTFLLRPHCGEAGDTDHLAAGLLVSHSISHGIMLRKVPLLQYIFYLDQIGIAMSPLSNNALFLTYDRNPFISYFRKGLNVSLSTDDPLQFAFTKEPLIEEYSVAAQIYKLGAVDMCELAKHSVDQCGFELQLKQRWLGKFCYLPGVLGNDVARSNVPDLREAFRHETLKAEHTFIARYTGDHTHLERCNPSLPDPGSTDTRVTDIYKSLEDPKQYYANTARIQSNVSLRSMTNGNTLNRQTSNSNSTAMPPLARQPSPIQRRASIVMQSPSGQINPSDQHISAHEPRFFPGLVKESHRRFSMRSQASGANQNNTSDMSASFELESPMMRMKDMKLKDGHEADYIPEVEDSD